MKKYTPEGEKTQFATLEEENRALKLENAELKIERDMLKKAAAYFAKNQKVKPEEKYEFIDEHPEYAAAKWARYLGVSLSGYYSWKNRREQRQKEVEEYKKMIKTIFQESNGTYGVDRICGELRKRGKTASYHRVKGFMDDMGLHSIHKRRRQKSLTDSRKARG
ncbi:MAG: IS3 family transposase [Syntrophaceticus schinkii]